MNINKKLSHMLGSTLCLSFSGHALVLMSTGEGLPALADGYVIDCSPPKLPDDLERWEKKFAQAECYEEGPLTSSRKPKPYQAPEAIQRSAKVIKPTRYNKYPTFKSRRR